MSTLKCVVLPLRSVNRFKWYKILLKSNVPAFLNVRNLFITSMEKDQSPAGGEKLFQGVLSYPKHTTGSHGENPDLIHLKSPVGSVRPAATLISQAKISRAEKQSPCWQMDGIASRRWGRQFSRKPTGCVAGC